MAVARRSSYDNALNALQARLDGITRYINGDDAHHPPAGAPSAEKRLQSITQEMQNLKTEAIWEQLVELNQRFPELHSSEAPSLPLNEQAISVKASATSFASTAAQLGAVRDHPLASVPASLSALDSDLDRHEAQVAMLHRDFVSTRCKAGTVAARYHQLLNLTSGGRWADWDERLRRVQQTLQRLHASSLDEGHEI